MKPQTPKQTVHFAQAALVQPVINFLQDTGIPLEKYLLQAGITPGLLQDQTTPIPRDLIFQFLNAVSEGEGIEDICLLVGAGTSLQTMGEFGEALLGTGTVRTYLTRGCRLISSASSGDYYWLVDESDQLRFCASVSSLDEKDTVQDYLYILLITINTIRQATDHAWSPTEINIPAMTPATAARLADYLPATKISCEGRHASFLVPYTLLGTAVGTGSNPPVLDEDALPSGFTNSITQLIETLIIAGRPKCKIVAKAAGMSSRTLQRRLKKAGTSYTELAATARIRLAKKWIDAGEISIATIARDLGYRDPANFSRAFRRLEGCSPSAYRNRPG